MSALILSPHLLETRKEHVPLLQSIRSTGIRWRQQIDMRAIFASPLTILVLVVALISLGRGFFVPYFNLYFVKHLGASPALFGIIDGSANALTALLTLGAPWLAARIGKINAITVTRLAGIPLLLAIGFTGFVPLAAVLYPLRQGVTDMSVGIFQVFFMEAVSAQRRGLANSCFQAADQIGAVLTTPLGGLIIVHMGYQPVFVIGAVVYLVAFSTLWLRFRNAERMHVGDVEDKEDVVVPGKLR